MTCSVNVYALAKHLRDMLSSVPQPREGQNIYARAGVKAWSKYVCECKE